MKLQIFILFVALCALVDAAPRNRKHEAYEEEDGSLVRAQRQAGGGDHHDAVDFGAHTGDQGAFGWYADFPVHSH